MSKNEGPDQLELFDEDVADGIYGSPPPSGASRGSNKGSTKSIQFLDSFLHRQKLWLKNQKEASRKKVADGKQPTKVFTLPRSTELLRPHDQYDPEWYFCVPPHFNEALDIHLIERTQQKNKKIVRRWMAWTQGSFFAFSAGDILYDTYTLEGEPWSEQLKRMTMALQIENASKADLLESGDDVVRFAGKVECKVLTPSQNHDRLEDCGKVSMSQDDFVKVLITGPNKAIQSLIGVN